MIHTLRANLCVRRHPIENEELFLWEWLPATIIAVRRGGLPQEKSSTSRKPVMARYRFTPAACNSAWRLDSERP